MANYESGRNQSLKKSTPMLFSMIIFNQRWSDWPFTNQTALEVFSTIVFDKHYRDRDREK